MSHFRLRLKICRRRGAASITLFFSSEPHAGQKLSGRGYAPTQALRAFCCTTVSVRSMANSCALFRTVFGLGPESNNRRCPSTSTSAANPHSPIPFCKLPASIVESTVMRSDLTAGSAAPTARTIGFANRHKTERIRRVFKVRPMTFKQFTRTKITTRNSAASNRRRAVELHFEIEPAVVFFAC